ncbi:MAG: VOC family protein [Candidatus Obscuribacterales bacterium]|nr:VOC family protein [Candidatus Obscuribacterales bacterium]
MSTKVEVKNTFCWIDVPVTDLERAIKFYTAILGQTVQKIAEHGFEFGLLPHEENNVSGCLTVMPDRKPSKDGPLVYLNVDGRLDKAIAEVKEHGGEVIKAKEPIGPYGFRAVIVDTEGNAIALHAKNA